jgi:hypothetical protein
MTGLWRKLHNEELHELYSSQNIITGYEIKEEGWAGHVVNTGEIINYILILKSEEEKISCGT